MSDEDGLQDDLDDEASTDGGSEDSQSGDAGAADKPKGDESSGVSEAQRRLQSERDQERARANKAEKELKSLKAASANGQGESGIPTNVNEWIVAAQENQRKALFAEYPEFSTYNIDAALIVGDTPAEMRASAKSLSEFVATLQGKVRQSVLVEHGFTPEPQSSQVTGRKDYATMDSKDFDKLVENALRG